MSAYSYFEYRPAHRPSPLPPPPKPRSRLVSVIVLLVVLATIFAATGAGVYVNAPAPETWNVAFERGPDGTAVVASRAAVDGSVLTVVCDRRMLDLRLVSSRPIDNNVGHAVLSWEIGDRVQDVDALTGRMLNAATFVDTRALVEDLAAATDVVRVSWRSEGHHWQTAFTVAGFGTALEAMREHCGERVPAPPRPSPGR